MSEKVTNKNNYNTKQKMGSRRRRNRPRKVIYLLIPTCVCDQINAIQIFLCIHIKSDTLNYKT
jgi:hypothetical protein